jgi:hypothetical protein
MCTSKAPSAKNIDNMWDDSYEPSSSHDERGRFTDSGDQMNEKDGDLGHAVDGIKVSKTADIWPFFVIRPHSLKISDHLRYVAKTCV